MTESYLAVAGRIRREVEQIEDVVDRAQAIWADVAPNRPVDHRIDAVALNPRSTCMGSMLGWSESLRSWPNGSTRRFRRAEAGIKSYWSR